MGVDLFGLKKRMSDLFYPSVSVSDPATRLPDHVIGCLLPNDNALYLTCASIYQYIGQFSLQFIKKKLKQSPVKIHFRVANQKWCADTKTWIPLKDQSEAEECILFSDLKPFLIWTQLRRRKTKQEKERVLAEFGILDACVTGAIENEVLSVLHQCIPFSIELQYRLGKYRLDAFIPRLRIAIQIDEDGHKCYPENEEKEYDQVIRDAAMVLIRFNPDQHVEPGYALVKEIWARTISPDFCSFREKYKLV